MEANTYMDTRRENTMGKTSDPGKPQNTPATTIVYPNPNKPIPPTPPLVQSPWTTTKTGANGGNAGAKIDRK